jgi:3-phenylpropionate/trans-cinnamate dioxygenase ferredoxin reductase subunit|tara:strand:+ start:546 stop:1703 length:1158 start_codon:yes stop_codon:yes gene_type:complete
LKNIIIVGASHAAVEAIVSLRKLGWQEEITLIGDEDSLPYQRPPLSKGYLKDEISREKMALRPPEFYQKSSVNLLLGRKVIEIDRKSKLVKLDNGMHVQYEKLILATGTRPKKLTVKGSKLNQINYLRTLKDVDHIKNIIKKDTKVLVVGAGYIGLELAASATKQKAVVAVVENMDRVLARVTGPEISNFYQHIHAEKGVAIHLGVSIKEFVNHNGKYSALIDNDLKLEFDCVVVGIGVEPNVELAENAGIECDNGILVNEFTQTNDPDIHAIGDCSNHPSFIYDVRIRLESVPNAIGQAKTAANYICGNKQPYNQVPWFWSDQYDIKLQSAGLAHDYDRTEINGDITNKKFTVSYFKQGRMIAMDAINSPKDFMVAKKIIAQSV